MEKFSVTIHREISGLLIVDDFSSVQYEGAQWDYLGLNARIYGTYSNLLAYLSAYNNRESIKEPKVI